MIDYSGKCTGAFFSLRGMGVISIVLFTIFNIILPRHYVVHVIFIFSVICRVSGSVFISRSVP